MHSVTYDMHQNANTAPKRKQSSASTNNNSPRTLPPLDTALWRIIQQLEDTIILLRFKSTLTSTFGKCVSFPWDVLKERSVYARSRATVFGVRLSPALPRARVTVERANVSRRWERIDYGAKFRPKHRAACAFRVHTASCCGCPAPVASARPIWYLFWLSSACVFGCARETTTRGGIAFAAKSKRQLVRSHTHTHIPLVELWAAKRTTGRRLICLWDGMRNRSIRKTSVRFARQLDTVGRRVRTRMQPALLWLCAPVGWAKRVCASGAKVWKRLNYRTAVLMKCPRTGLYINPLVVAKKQAVCQVCRCARMCWRAYRWETGVTNSGRTNIVSM